MRIIPEDGKGYSQEYHPLERFLQENDRACYLDIWRDGFGDDYCVDLREIEVAYSWDCLLAVS